MTGIIGIGLALCAQLLIVLGFIAHSMVALLLGFVCLFGSIHLLVKAMQITNKESK